MARTQRGVAVATLEVIGGYDPNAAARRLTVPLRAINGDLFPTNLDAIRAIKSDFQPIVMPHTGHYPMLEHPEQFNLYLARIVQELESRGSAR